MSDGLSGKPDQRIIEVDLGAAADGLVSPVRKEKKSNDDANCAFHAA
jgi:hypothetical protein